MEYLSERSSILIVPRPPLHRTDVILDVARSLALDSGAGATTIAEIAQASGTPVGSLYHRFGSRDDLLAQLWIRAVRRSQASFLSAIDRGDPIERAVMGAMAILDFCEEQGADARLLLSLRREDLLRAAPSPEVARELEGLNRPLERGLARLAHALYGTAGQAERQRVLLAAFDIPYGAARRHLVAGKPLPASLRADVQKAVRAVLAGRTGKRH
jgi:AcrR family transcriptional regulator